MIHSANQSVTFSLLSSLHYSPIIKQHARLWVKEESWYTTAHAIVLRSMLQSNKTSVSLHIFLTHLLISPILRSHSPLLRSTHGWKQNSLNILSRFHSCTITRPPSSQTATIAPRCFPGLTFPDFDLAPKRNERFGYCGLDLV